MTGTRRRPQVTEFRLHYKLWGFSPSRLIPHGTTSAPPLTFCFHYFDLTGMLARWNGIRYEILPVQCMRLWLVVFIMFDVFIIPAVFSRCKKVKSFVFMIATAQRTDPEFRICGDIQRLFQLDSLKAGKPLTRAVSGDISHWNWGSS